MDKRIVELQNLYFKKLLSPKEWFVMAKGLEISAATLQRYRVISKDPVQVFYDRAQEFMLWGFCIENLMKGLFSRKMQAREQSLTKKKEKGLKYDGPSHDLNDIAEKISFMRNDKEKRVLDFLSRAATYFGRYPSPLFSEKMTIYWEDSFDPIINSLLDRLKKEAGV